MKLPADPISLPKAAKLADVTERWMRTLVDAGRVEGVKIGRNYVVSESSAKAFKRTENMGRPRQATARRARKVPKSRGK